MERDLAEARQWESEYPDRLYKRNHFMAAYPLTFLRI